MKDVRIPFLFLTDGWCCMNLEEFFGKYNKVALAFSGGVDSAYLLYAAVKAGADVKAYYVKSAFQPEFELNDAKKLAEELGAQMEVLPVDVLGNEEVRANPKDRCYYCKKVIFSTIIYAAAKDGYEILLDGTNASDEEGDRPGMRALRELTVYSPLRMCGLTKDEIRRLSKEAGLFTWDKPAYACLATRVPTGVCITGDILKATEKAEDYLFSLGFTDFRVRYLNGAAKLQLREYDMERFVRNREIIFTELSKYYTSVLLDLEVRK